MNRIKKIFSYLILIIVGLFSSGIVVNAADYAWPGFDDNIVQTLKKKYPEYEYCVYSVGNVLTSNDFAKISKFYSNQKYIFAYSSTTNQLKFVNYDLQLKSIDIDGYAWDKRGFNQSIHFSKDLDEKLNQDTIEFSNEEAELFQSYIKNKFPELAEKYLNQLNEEISELVKRESIICDISSIREQKINELNEYIRNIIGRYNDEVVTAIEVSIMKKQEAGEDSTKLDEIKDAVLVDYNDFVEKSNKITSELIDFYSYYNKVDGECQAILGEDALDLINEVIKWLRISVPIILVVFGSIDFGKAVIADDKDIMKKASSSFIKRCIVAIAIFFLPTLINILISIFNSVSKKPLADLINCGIK